MSKWLRKEDYEMFADQKAKDKENASNDTVGGFYKKWKNPQMGTQDKAKEYKVRMLPDPKKGYYKNYLYHGFKSGESFNYFLCEKTYDMDAYCPFCDVTKILYQGNESDKRKASEYKRKERFVSNIFIADDPRDAETKDEDYKVNGTVRLYEFPATVESKISNEVTDKEQGYGIAIFDPEEGFDFIIKVKAKPKDKNGKEWPDYGDTMFARKASVIAPLREGSTIETVMEERVDLEEYIKSLRKTPEELEKLLKAEMLWDDVGHTFEKRMKVADSTTQAPVAAPAEAPAEAPASQPEAPAQQEAAPAEAPAETPAPASDDDTDALLAELQEM